MSLVVASLTISSVFANGERERSGGCPIDFLDSSEIVPKKNSWKSKYSFENILFFIKIA